LIEARTQDDATSGRDVIWEIYEAAIEKNPWFGRGIGSGTLLLPNTESYTKVISTAHNEYLRMIMDGGLVGLMIYILALIVWMRSELRFMRRNESVVFLGFMVAFAVYSITDNTISGQATPVAFFALALIVHRARQRTAEAARVVRMRDHPMRIAAPATLASAGRKSD
jgi:O-antigen ligase